jgi:hypothetical protein
VGEVNPDELDLSIDDALIFLIQYQRSTSLSKNFVNLRSFMERRVKDELGVDVAVHLAQHEARMNELENLYD